MKRKKRSHQNLEKYEDNVNENLMGTEDMGQSTHVEFFEDGNVVDMHALGDETEFRSDEESEEETEVSISQRRNVVSRSRSRSLSHESHNNNAISDEGEILDEPDYSHNRQKKRRISGKLNQDEKEEVIEEACARFQRIMDQSGFAETASLIREHFGNKQGNSNCIALNQKNPKNINGSPPRSEVTIYRNALIDQTDRSKDRLSSSSDKPINTSDEIMEIECDQSEKVEELNNVEMMVSNFIAENRPKENAYRDVQDRTRTRTNEGPQQGTSSHRQKQCGDGAEKRIQEAKNARVKMFATPGRSQQLLHSTLVDDDYLVLAAHVDETLKEKIKSGDYVDLSKLLPKDRLSQQEDQRMQIVNRNGQTFWIPVNDNQSINSFAKWEVAFRAYTDIYARANPHRSSELIQYSHIIHTIVSQYIWENVYDYDKDFRLHMARYPDRNWSIILQQAWSMRLKDRLRSSEFMGSRTPSQDYHKSGHNNKHNNEACRKYNRSKCNFGSACKFEHKCSYCFKMGHPILKCRKLQADRDGNNSKKENNATPSNSDNKAVN